MIRFIMLLFAVFFCFRLLLHFLVKLINYKHNFSDNYKAKKQFSKNQVKSLAQCDYCGLYIIKEESLCCNGKTFCCKEHAKGI